MTEFFWNTFFFFLSRAQLCHFSLTAYFLLMVWLQWRKIRGDFHYHNFRGAWSIELTMQTLFCESKLSFWVCEGGRRCILECYSLFFSFTSALRGICPKLRLSVWIVKNPDLWKRDYFLTFLTVQDCYCMWWLSSEGNLNGPICLLLFFYP